MRNIEYINGVSGVAPGGVATLLCPVNRRYHGLKLFFTGLKEGATSGTYDVATTNPIDLVELVRLIVNGVVMRELTPTEIIRIAGMNKNNTQVTNHLPFLFSDPDRASITGEEATSWDLFGQNTFVVEVLFKTAIASPTMTTQASYDYGRNMADGAPFLAIVKQKSVTYNVPTGEFNMVTLPKGEPILRAHIQPSSGTVTKVEVTRDSEKVFEATKAQNDELLKDYGITTPFGYSVVFNHDQQLSSPLVVQRDLDIKATFSAANSAKVTLETIARAFR